MEATRPKHSRLGILSTVSSLAAIPALAYLAYLGYAYIRSDTWEYDFTQISRIGFYTFIYSCLTLVLGIIGLFEKKRVRLYAWIGIVFSMLFLLADLLAGFFMLVFSMPL